MKKDVLMRAMDNAILNISPRLNLTPACAKLVELLLIRDAFIKEKSERQSDQLLEKFILKCGERRGLSPKTPSSLKGFMTVFNLNKLEDLPRALNLNLSKKKLMAHPPFKTEINQAPLTFLKQAKLILTLKFYQSYFSRYYNLEQVLTNLINHQPLPLLNLLRNVEQNAFSAGFFPFNPRHNLSQALLNIHQQFSLPNNLNFTH